MFRLFREMTWSVRRFTEDLIKLSIQLKSRTVMDLVVYGYLQHFIYLVSLTFIYTTSHTKPAYQR